MRLKPSLFACISFALILFPALQLCASCRLARLVENYQKRCVGVVMGECVGVFYVLVYM